MVVQHVGFEEPGTIADVAAEHGVARRPHRHLPPDVPIDRTHAAAVERVGRRVLGRFFALHHG